MILCYGSRRKAIQGERFEWGFFSFQQGRKWLLPSPVLECKGLLLQFPACPYSFPSTSSGVCGKDSMSACNCLHVYCSDMLGFYTLVLILMQPQAIFQKFSFLLPCMAALFSFHALPQANQCMCFVFPWRYLSLLKFQTSWWIQEKFGFCRVHSIF